MKYIKEMNTWFNKSKEGDSIVSRIFDIVKEENIKISHNGGYTIEIDDYIYSFSHIGIYSVGKYNKSQRIISGEYKGIITGHPISNHEFSNKLWKELIKIYDNQQKNVDEDLDILNPVTRSSKKFNI